jgi:cephalosporin hydroxylase/SAM-dependent methyltransferase
MVSTDSCYAPPWTVESADECYFYHSLELPEDGFVAGDWDLREGANDYLGHTPLAGRRVLEIGPASGFLTFHMESRGAEVVAVELAPGADWDMVPQAGIDLERFRQEQNEIMERVRRGFWFAHARLGSAARVHYSSAYEIPAELGRFDLAVMGSVCLHLRDPLLAVESCARLSDNMIITDRRWEELTGSPVARLTPSAESGEWGTWWDLSPELLVRFLRVLGYAETTVSFHTQRFNGANGVTPVPMFTVVARRHGASEHVTPRTQAARSTGVPNSVPGTDGESPVAVDLMPALTQESDPLLAALWRSRVKVHEGDTYAGLRMTKFPEDLRTYETLLWERKPQVVIELGVHHGGSTLWLRDRLFDFQRYRAGAAPMVIGVDIDLSEARTSFSDLPPEGTAGIELREGDIRSDEFVAEIISMVPGDAEVLVIEDAQHDAETTLAALRGFAPLIRAGGYYVVEDTCVDVDSLRVNPDWPRGCARALEQWLTEDPLGRRFRRRGDLQPYGLTCHPGGLIQRLTDV